AREMGTPDPRLAPRARTSTTVIGQHVLADARAAMTARDMKSAYELNEKVIGYLANGAHDGVVDDEHALRQAWMHLNPGSTGTHAELNAAIDRRRAAHRAAEDGTSGPSGEHVEAPAGKLGADGDDSGEKPQHTHVRVGGDTYPVRGAIKAHGGRWDGRNKEWVVPAGEVGKLRQRLPRHTHDEDKGWIHIASPGRAPREVTPPPASPAATAEKAERTRRFVNTILDARAVLGSGWQGFGVQPPDGSRLVAQTRNKRIYLSADGREITEITTYSDDEHGRVIDAPHAVNAARAIAGMPPLESEIITRVAADIAAAPVESTADARRGMGRAINVKMDRMSGSLVADFAPAWADRKSEESIAETARICAVLAAAGWKVHPATASATIKATSLDGIRAALAVQGETVAPSAALAAEVGDDDDRPPTAEEIAAAERDAAADDREEALNRESRERNEAAIRANAERREAEATEAQARITAIHEKINTYVGTLTGVSDNSAITRVTFAFPGISSHDAEDFVSRARYGKPWAEHAHEVAALASKRAAEQAAAAAAIVAQPTSVPDKLAAMRAQMAANRAAHEATAEQRAHEMAMRRQLFQRLVIKPGQRLTIDGVQYRVHSVGDMGQYGRRAVLDPVGGRLKAPRELYIRPRGDAELHGGGRTNLVHTIDGAEVGDTPHVTPPRPPPKGYVSTAVPKAPEGTPRADAEAVTAKAAEGGDYVNDRSSLVEQRGEDVRGSARHRALEWRSVRDALASADAEKLFTRDFLAKQEPFDMLAGAQAAHASGDRRAVVEHLALHLAASKFPPKPSDDHVRRNPASAREGYYRAYKAMTATLGAMATSGALRTVNGSSIEHQQVVINIANELRRLHQKEREEHGYGAGSEALRTLYNRFVKDKAVDDFLTRLARKYPNEEERNAHLGEHALAVIEGDSMNAAFDTKATKKEDINVAALYSTSVMTREGPPSEFESVAQGLDMLDKSKGGKFGMRGVQWGKSVTDDERKHHLKSIVDSCADLTDVLGLPPGMASYNGKLAIAVGARGRAGALAHYEPSTKAINLTREGGAGSLCHEWAHFFDNVLNEAGERGGHYRAGAGASFASNDAMTAAYRGEDETKPVYREMAELYASPAFTKFRERLRSDVRTMVRSNRMSEKKAEYWLSGHEVFARVVERHVQHQLHKQGRENTYLTGLRKIDGGSPGQKLWPTDEEIEALGPHVAKVFSAFATSDLLHKAMRLVNPSYVIPLRKARALPSTGATPVVASPALPDYSIFHKQDDPKQRELEAEQESNRRRVLAPKLRGKAGFFGAAPQPEPVLRFDPDEQLAPYQERAARTPKLTARATVPALTHEKERSDKIATRLKFAAKLSRTP
ncbi:MAG: hypothetical protein M3Q55_06645, partial [Acidobacteriota bacterium]|nr:hypothetical protein [Acidobacteriota bacterium]